MVERAHRTGTHHDWDLHRALARRGWLAAAWPKEAGGQGRTPFEAAVIEEELIATGMPRVRTTMVIANGIRLLGTPEQQATILPRVLAGEILLCLGWTEPDAGSDVASVRTTARRDGDGWIITGQKMFTTLAHESAYVFLLTRTNPDVPKHQGLTTFLVPLDPTSIELRRIDTLGSERTNVLYLDDLRVGDETRIGEVDGGWTVMATMLGLEHGATWAPDLRRMLDKVVALLHAPEAGDLDASLDDPLVRHRLARAATLTEVSSLLADRVRWLNARGASSHVEACMSKLFSSEAMVEVAQDLLDLLGPEALLSAGEPGAPLGGEPERWYRQSVVRTIYAGTSEIQRGIIAERGLGLGRSR
jgi:alkylation response protein AidB-like acyl-CoA dehydrogenase